jgi:antitoxin PrlF
MPKATVTSKGQVTLPKTVRDQLGLRTGDRISFGEVTGNKVTIEAVTRVTIDDLIGILPRPDRARTIEEMNTDVREARECREKHGRT